MGSMAVKEPFLKKGIREKRLSNANYRRTGLTTTATGLMNPNLHRYAQRWQRETCNN